MKKVGELYLLEMIQGLQQEISINIIGLWPKSNDKNTIVVIVNWFTKMIRLKTMMIAILLEEIAKIYRNNIWKILSNRESQFASENLSKALGKKQILLIVYHF